MDTRQALLDAAAELVRVRGYSGFSYADLSQRIGIRKASIHHHFPTKEDLGLALIDRYIEDFSAALQRIAATSITPKQKLIAYTGLYRESLQQGWGCLCGMLASDIEVVPANVAAGVRRFMDLNLGWLAGVVAEGQRSGALASGLQSEPFAFMLLSVCQGALLVARPSRDIAGFDRAVNQVLTALIEMD
jgi:TetR/AcrR family transcriptional regulator, transcriptional repressor for nem operon